MARGSYGYDNRYMLEGSFGLTGSENFAEGHRYGIFPLSELPGMLVTRNS